MAQQNLEIIVGIIIIVIVLGLSYLILISNKKNDVKAIKKQFIETLKLKNTHVNLFIVLTVISFIVSIYIYPSKENKDLILGVIFTSIIFTSIILTGRIFLNTYITKGEILSSKQTFTLWNIRSYGGFHKYKSKVKYSKGTVKLTGFMTSFYERIGKTMYILVDKKDETVIHPLGILIFKGIAISILGVMIILANIDDIIKLF